MPSSKFHSGRFTAHESCIFSDMGNDTKLVCVSFSMHNISRSVFFSFFCMRFTTCLFSLRVPMYSFY